LFWVGVILLAGPRVAVPQDVVVWLDEVQPTDLPPIPGSEPFVAPANPEWQGAEDVVWSQPVTPDYVAPDFMMPGDVAPGAFMPDVPPPGYQPWMGRSCPPWRPCGPANSFGANWLFYQGAYGADFRTACQNHDDCLMNPWNSRKACDRAFLDQMSAECANSTHPALCMWKAHKYYVAVRAFGGLVRAGAP
jgi:hypothetical protein